MTWSQSVSSLHQRATLLPMMEEILCGTQFVVSRLNQVQFGFWNYELRRTAIQAHENLREHPNERLTETFQSSGEVQTNLPAKFHHAT